MQEILVRQVSIKQRFLVFSVLFFLVILGAGTSAFSFPCGRQSGETPPWN